MHYVALKKDEASELLEFVSDLDFTEYINDLEVKKLLVALRKRVSSLQKKKKKIKDVVQTKDESEASNEAHRSLIEETIEEKQTELQQMKFTPLISLQEIKLNNVYYVTNDFKQFQAAWSEAQLDKFSKKDIIKEFLGRSVIVLKIEDDETVNCEFSDYERHWIPLTALCRDLKMESVPDFGNIDVVSDHSSDSESESDLMPITMCARLSVIQRKEQGASEAPGRRASRILPETNFI